MNRTLSLPTKAAAELSPAIARKIKASTRERSFSLVLRDSLTINGGDIGWSGGSKSSYSYFDRNGQPLSLAMPASWAGASGPVETTNELTTGKFALETGYFMGKPSTLRLYVADLPSLWGLESPFDANTPVEVVADWLDEAGHASKAEFIRQHIAQAV